MHPQELENEISALKADIQSTTEPFIIHIGRRNPKRRLRGNLSGQPFPDMLERPGAFWEPFPGEPFGMKIQKIRIRGKYSLGVLGVIFIVNLEFSISHV